MNLINNYVATETKLVDGQKLVKIYVINEQAYYWCTQDQVIELQNNGIEILFLDYSLNIKGCCKVKKISAAKGCVAFLKEPPNYLWGNSELHISNNTTGCYTVLTNFPYKIIQGKKISVEQVSTTDYGVLILRLTFKDKQGINYVCQFCTAEGGVHNTPQLLFVSQYTSISF